MYHGVGVGPVIQEKPVHSQYWKDITWGHCKRENSSIEHVGTMPACYGLRTHCWTSVQCVVNVHYLSLNLFAQSTFSRMSQCMVEV